MKDFNSYGTYQITKEDDVNQGKTNVFLIRRRHNWNLVKTDFPKTIDNWLKELSHSEE